MFKTSLARDMRGSGGGSFLSSFSLIWSSDRASGARGALFLDTEKESPDANPLLMRGAYESLLP
jgi:hypothetical protein